jgi:hypothetical protein
MSHPCGVSTATTTTRASKAYTTPCGGDMEFLSIGDGPGGPAKASPLPAPEVAPPQAGSDNGRHQQQQLQQCYSRPWGGGDPDLLAKHMMERFHANPLHSIERDITFLDNLLVDLECLCTLHGKDGSTRNVFGVEKAEWDPPRMGIREVARMLHLHPADESLPIEERGRWRREADAYMLRLARRWQNDTSVALREHLSFCGVGSRPPTLGGALNAWRVEGRKRVGVIFSIVPYEG